MINAIMLTDTLAVESYMYFVWLGIFVIAVIVEALTSELVAVWFVGGAFIAFLTSFIPGLPFWGEILIFVISSLILLFTLRPLVNKTLKRRQVETNVDEMIGKKAKVIKTISELERGEIKLYGVVWTAESNDPEITIEEGETIRIVSIEGNKVVVEKYENKKKGDK